MSAFQKLHDIGYKPILETILETSGPKVDVRKINYEVKHLIPGNAEKALHVIYDIVTMMCTSTATEENLFQEIGEKVFEGAVPKASKIVKRVWEQQSKELKDVRRKMLYAAEVEEAKDSLVLKAARVYSSGKLRINPEELCLAWAARALTAAEKKTVESYEKKKTEAAKNDGYVWVGVRLNTRSRCMLS